MRFGPNAKKLTIIRRAQDGDGNLTGPFADAFETWAAWTQNPGVLAQNQGQRDDPIDLVVKVNDCRQNRSITNADRARMAGTEYQVSSVGLPERKSASIQLVLARKANA